MKKFSYLFAVFVFWFCEQALAQVADVSVPVHSGLGGVAEELVEGPILGLQQFFYGVSYVVGLIFLYQAYCGFKGHKFNADFIGLGRPIFLLLLSLTFLFLPMAYHLLDVVY